MISYTSTKYLSSDVLLSTTPREDLPWCCDTALRETEGPPASPRRCLMEDIYGSALMICSGKGHRDTNERTRPLGDRGVRTRALAQPPPPPPPPIYCETIKETPCPRPPSFCFLPHWNDLFMDLDLVKVCMRANVSIALGAVGVSSQFHSTAAWFYKHTQFCLTKRFFFCPPFF